MNTTISWLIWKGDIFRVPLSTLYRRKEQEGWDLINISAKSQALFLYRIRQNMMKGRTITWAWLRTWGLSAKGTSPPFRDVIPEGLGYLRCFAMDSAYIEEQGTVESKGVYKRRVYNTLYIMNRRETGTQEMRIVGVWPTTDWTAVWRNLHSTPVTDAMKTAWHKAINDITPTNDRLYRIRISTTDKCNKCGTQDTVIHRLIECGKGPKIWQ
jgi:hypothetical protein